VGLTLQKWHGAGNDFLVDVTDAAGARRWTPERAAALCDRHLGVGADGLLVAERSDSLVTMVLYNADGSRAEMSGNGIRCLAAAVRRATGEPGETLTVMTDAGERTVSLRLDGLDGYGEVDMGQVSLGEPPAGALGVATVGNPHVVVLDDERWSVNERERLAEGWSGPLGGANVEFATVLSPERVRITVRERGVGWTLACGTGSVAVAAVLAQAGLVSSRVHVENPGGVLAVTLEGDRARLGGPVRFVADVTLLLA
jgi:diaminopimelate epimerase